MPQFGGQRFYLWLFAVIYTVPWGFPKPWQAPLGSSASIGFRSASSGRTPSLPGRFLLPASYLDLFRLNWEIFGGTPGAIEPEQMRPL